MQMKMRKVLVSSAVTMQLVLAGCSSAQYSYSESDGIYHLPKSHTAKTALLHKKVMQAGEQAGWKMTPFKSDMIIGEKIVGDESMSVTISFATENITISVDNSDISSGANDYVEDLIEAIEKIEQEQTH
ncbi:MAG: hypothetical protein FAF05_04440 [Epsilonproteobacteria bacterium]|nr:hypothetical protein [Campylobacterota bacterium]